MARRQLAALDVECDLAESGAKALVLMAQQDYVLVLTDISMPGMSGVELTTEILT